MIYQNFKSNSETQTIVQSTNFTSVNLMDKGRYVKAFGVQIAATLATPIAKVFTADNATEIFTATAHGFSLGLKIQVATTGVLPVGLSAVTDYFVIPIDANTFKLATSLVNANAGTNLSITTDGTGTQTATPVALAGATYKIQGSLDGTNWADLNSPVSITGTSVFLFQAVDPIYLYARAVYAITAGSLTIDQITSVVGE